MNATNEQIETIKRHGLGLKQQVGMALSEDECYDIFYSFLSELEVATKPIEKEEPDICQDVIWRCSSNLVMQGKDKLVAFVEGKQYKQIGSGSGYIVFTNEQGYHHSIEDDFIGRYFNAI